MVEMTCVHCRRSVSTKDATIQYPRSRRLAHWRCVGDQRPESLARMDALILAGPPVRPLPKHLARLAR